MLKYLLTGAAGLMLASTAVAHEFNVTLVVPAGAQTAARQAFVLASAERDSHSNETSEGHLGGVDSQLEIVTDGQPVPASDVVVAIAGAMLPEFADTGGQWSFQVTTLSVNAEADFLLPGPAPFSTRYTARYGAQPDDTATLVYVAARMIDLAVRQQDGVTDISALENRVKNY